MHFLNFSQKINVSPCKELNSLVHSDGHNLLFHGLGSKRFLLDMFRTTMLADFTHLVINGYFPSITIKQALSSIIEDVIGHEGTISNPLDQVEFIKNHYTLHGMYTLKPHCIQSSRVLMPAGTSKSRLHRHSIQAVTGVMAYFVNALTL
jgi:hypothetical protein